MLRSILFALHLLQDQRQLSLRCLASQSGDSQSEACAGCIASVSKMLEAASLVICQLAWP